MDTLEELKYYCDEPQPVGALMLTGEWGCGKTYLLNNSLSNALKDKSSQPQILFNSPKPPSHRTCLMKKACTSQVQQIKRKSA